MKIETIILAIGLVSVGMMTGIFFTWTNAVTPGISKLSDHNYLEALQSMNRAILNNSFRALFLIAVLAVFLLPIIHYKTHNGYLLWILIAAFFTYSIGSFAVTVWGNIPLNRMVDNAQIDILSNLDAKNLRVTIETKWNFLNLIRASASIASFFLLILFCICHKN